MKRSTATVDDDKSDAEPEEEKRPKQQPNRKTFTDLMLKRLKPKSRQYLVWDVPSRQGGQLGLSVLVSPGGTKRFRATYYLSGKAISKKLGRVGEMSLGRARELTAELRGKADEGRDPKEEEREERLRAAEDHAKTFEVVVRQYIEEDAKIYQKTWQQTENILLKNCAEWRDRPFASITKREAKTLLRKFVSQGTGYKARVTCAYINRLWRWAKEEELVPDNVMEGLSIAFEQEPKRRLEPYGGDEIKAIWKAAETLSSVEEAYVKLIILLAPRKGELRTMDVAHLDDPKSPTLWTTPHEITKSRKKLRKEPIPRKRVYLTPLPKLAQRILKPLLRDDTKLVFPSSSKESVPMDAGTPLAKKLKAAGAPVDFNYHCARHTIETWLGNEGHDEFDQKLALNHVLVSGATRNYSHGYGVQRKLDLLNKWADHVEGLVTPKGVKALR